MTRLEMETTRARRRGPVGHLAHGLLWIIVLALMVFTGWRLFGPDLSWPIAVALAYTPYVLIACAVPILIAIGLRAGRLLAVTVLCACVLTALMVPRVVGGAPHRDGTTITVMTANIAGSEANLDEAVTIATDSEVDVLLVRGTTRPLADELGEQLSSTLAHEGHYGTTFVYSKRALTQQGAGFEIDIGDGTVQLVGADLPKPASRDGFTRWREGFAAFPTADETDGAHMIIAGSFNATLDHATFRDLLDTGYTDATEAAGKRLTHVWDLSKKPAPFAPQRLIAGPALHVAAAHQHDLPETATDALVSTLVLVED